MYILRASWMGSLIHILVWFASNLILHSNDSIVSSLLTNFIQRFLAFCQFSGHSYSHFPKTSIRHQWKSYNASLQVLYFGNDWAFNSSLSVSRLFSSYLWITLYFSHFPPLPIRTDVSFFVVIHAMICSIYIHFRSACPTRMQFFTRSLNNFFIWIVDTRLHTTIII